MYITRMYIDLFLLYKYIYYARCKQITGCDGENRELCNLSVTVVDGRRFRKQKDVFMQKVIKLWKSL